MNAQFNNFNPANTVISPARLAPSRPSSTLTATEFLLRWREAQRVARRANRQPVLVRAGGSRTGGRI